MSQVKLWFSKCSPCSPGHVGITEMGGWALLLRTTAMQLSGCIRIKLLGLGRKWRYNDATLFTGSQSAVTVTITKEKAELRSKYIFQFPFS